jgi:hypothetical protein
MTGQVPDTLIYDKNSYSIAGLKGEGLPSPFDFNLKPVSPNTANWRGFRMTYIIIENRLQLHEMNVTIEDIERKPPIINEVKPILEKEGLINLSYNDLKLKTLFTGKILIAKDFIDSMYVHMGFQSPLSFETVIELDFKGGKLLRVKDLSKKMKHFREKDISDEKLKPTRDPQKWIARTFSLDYDF